MLSSLEVQDTRPLWPMAATILCLPAVPVFHTYSTRCSPQLCRSVVSCYLFAADMAINVCIAACMQGLDPFDEDGLSDMQIMTAIHNAAGTRPPLFVPQAAFEVLVKRQIKRLEEPVSTARAW